MFRFIICSYPSFVLLWERSNMISHLFWKFTPPPHYHAFYLVMLYSDYHAFFDNFRPPPSWRDIIFERSLSRRAAGYAYGRRPQMAHLLGTVCSSLQQCKGKRSKAAHLSCFDILWTVDHALFGILMGQVFVYGGVPCEAVNLLVANYIDMT